MKYLIATGNPHKAEAIRRIFDGLGMDFVDLSSFPEVQEPIEDGETFLENALIKSRYYCKATGLAAMADDSGLEVDALDKQPGIHSARFAGPDSPHSEKMAKILELIKDVPQEKRTGRFRCVAAVTYPDGREFHSDGSMEGTIAQEAFGSGGFGYDPIVYLPAQGKTVAELTDLEKDAISHRGVACRALLTKLPKL